MAQEMKAYTYDDMLDGDADIDVEYYRKSEADAVLAEKDAEIRRLKRALWIAREWRAWCEVNFWFILGSDQLRDVYHLSCTNRIHRTPVKWMAYWQKVEQPVKRRRRSTDEPRL